MFKFIFTAAIIAVAFINPMISVAVIIITILAAWGIQATGTATISSTMVTAFEMGGSTYGHTIGTAEDAWIKTKTISADNEVTRIELGLDVDTKAIPAFKNRVKEVEAKYAPQINDSKAKLAESLARVAEAKAKAEAARAAQA